MNNTRNLTHTDIVQCWLKEGNEYICVGWFQCININFEYYRYQQVSMADVKWELKRGVLDAFVFNKLVSTHEFVITFKTYDTCLNSDSSTSKCVTLTKCHPEYLYPASTQSNGKALVSHWTGTSYTQALVA